MTDIGSCKTCRYFDSKDWDSETKNWCRYNDLPAIYEGLCGHYEPMIRPCPFCGKELHRYEEDGEWVIECLTKSCLMICGPLCKKDAMERMLEVKE